MVSKWLVHNPGLLCWFCIMDDASSQVQVVHTCTSNIVVYMLLVLGYDGINFLLDNNAQITISVLAMQFCMLAMTFKQNRSTFIYLCQHSRITDKLL